MSCQELVPNVCFGGEQWRMCTEIDINESAFCVKQNHFRNTTQWSLRIMTVFFSVNKGCLWSYSEKHSSRAFGRLKIYISHRLPSSKQILIMENIFRKLSACVLAFAVAANPSTFRSAFEQKKKELEFDFPLEYVHRHAFLTNTLELFASKTWNFTQMYAKWKIRFRDAAPQFLAYVMTMKFIGGGEGEKGGCM